MKNHNLQKANGFTLIELLIVLVIVVILMAYGIPSYREFSMRQTMTNEANNFLSDLRYARSEAISRGGIVEVVALSSPSWTGGWRIQYRTSTSPLSYETLRRKEAIVSVGNFQMDSVAIGAVTDRVRFNSEGNITTPIVSVIIQNTPTYPNYITITMLASGMVSSNRGL